MSFTQPDPEKLVHEREHHQSALVPVTHLHKASACEGQSNSQRDAPNEKCTSFSRVGAGCCSMGDFACVTRGRKKHAPTQGEEAPKGAVARTHPKGEEARTHQNRSRSTLPPKRHPPTHRRTRHSPEADVRGTGGLGHAERDGKKEGCQAQGRERPRASKTERQPVMRAPSPTSFAPFPCLSIQLVYI